MKNVIWMTFDLGVRGDYEGMYAFLDNHGSKECGGSTAVFSYEFQNDLVAELQQELKDAVELDRKSRIYVVFPGESGKPKGRFIVGKRKQPPWTGYGTLAVEGEEEDSGE